MVMLTALGLLVSIADHLLPSRVVHDPRSLLATSQAICRAPRPRLTISVIRFAFPSRHPALTCTPLGTYRHARIGPVLEYVSLTLELHLVLHYIVLFRVLHYIYKHGQLNGTHPTRVAASAKEPPRQRHLYLHPNSRCSPSFSNRHALGYIGIFASMRSFGSVGDSLNGRRGDHS